MTLVTKPAIAYIDTLQIDVTEYQNRLNFNPPLHVYDVDNAKKIVFSSLLAEKLLFLESKKHKPSMDYDHDAIIKQHFFEAIIEQLRVDSVENKVQVSKEELLVKKKTSRKEIEVQYLVFKSKK